MSQLEEALLHHPAYVVLEHKDRCSPKGFISRKMLIESACAHLLTWCSRAEPREIITKTLGERICRLIASPYQLKPNELWTLLEQVGVIEKSGEENISTADIRTFLSFCQTWALQAEVVLFWEGFQVRAQSHISKLGHMDGTHEDYWLSQFDDDEKTLIERRIVNGETLDDLGLSFGVTKERVRQRVNKQVDRLRHPAFWRSFGYVLGQTLLALPSMRLVHSDSIAKGMEDYFGRRVTSRGLYRILRTIAMVEPIQVYESDWLWVNWEEDFVVLPGLESWDDEYEINKEEISLCCAKVCWKTQQSRRRYCISMCRRNSPIPQTPETLCHSNAGFLKRPAHVKDIVAKANELYPEFPEGLSTTRVNPVLQNLEGTGKIKKVAPAVYSLPEYAEEKIRLGSPRLRPM